MEKGFFHRVVVHPGILKTLSNVPLIMSKDQKDQKGETHLSTGNLLSWGLQGLPHLFLRKPFLPLMLNFLVTDRCTLRCRHCFNWKARKGGPELSLEEIEKISHHWGPIVYLILAGGEPFIREDLSEIATTFYRNNGVREVVILTDGQLTEKAVVTTKKILAQCPDLYLTVGISFDGVPTVHDSIRGRPGAFDQAVNTFREMSLLKKEFERLSLQTCSVVMAENQDSFDELLDIIRDELKPDKLAVNLIRQEPRDPSLLKVSTERYEAITKRIREETFRGRFQNKFRHDTSGFATLVDLYMHTLVARTRRIEKAQLTCQAGRLSAVLAHDGTLYPCEIRPRWGNLRDTDYRAEPLCFSPAAKACRKRIRAGCFCTHEIDCFLPSIPLNPRHFPAMVRLAYQWKKTAGWKKVN